MKKIIAVIFTVLLVSTIIFSGCGEPAEPVTPTEPTEPTTPTGPTEPTKPTEFKPIELVFSHQIPSIHARHTQVIGPLFTDEIEKRTDGRVKVTVYFAQALATSSDQYDACVAGTCDITETSHSSVPGRWPAHGVVELPPMGVDCLRPGYAYWELYQKYACLKEGLEDVKVLWLQGIGKHKMYFATKPVRTLEDLQGEKMAIVGTYRVYRVAALGATVVRINMADVYMSIQKGVIEGWDGDSDLLYSRRHGEVTKYVTGTYHTGQSFFVVMNRDSFNKLPSDVQQIIDELSGQRMTDAVDEFYHQRITECEANAVKDWGIEFIELTPEEAARWREKAQPVDDQWIAEVEAKGIPGKDLMNDFTSFCMKYAA